MKKTKENLEHRIQLKKDEITHYARVIKNYPPNRMNKCGIPHLRRLNNELQLLQHELDDRESNREIKVAMDYSRTGLKNV